MFREVTGAGNTKTGNSTMAGKSGPSHKGTDLLVEGEKRVQDISTEK
jgi:hypothetical protein